MRIAGRVVQIPTTLCRDLPFLASGLWSCWSTDLWFCGSVQIVSRFDFTQTAQTTSDIFFTDVEREKLATELLGDCAGCAATAERIEDKFSGIRADFRDPSQKLFRHLASVKSFSLFKRPCDSREVPSILFRA